MKTISILGCGWLGLPLAKALKRQGYVVKGSTTQEARLSVLQEEGILPYVISLDDENTFAQTHSFYETDVLVVTVPPRRKAGQTDAYYQQMKRLASHVATTAIQQLIFISSTSVYPALNRVVVEEDADPSFYLTVVEDIFHQQCREITTVLRFGGLVGPGRHPGRFFAGKPVATGGSVPINIIHLVDCIGIITKLIHDNVKLEIFNACADLHPTKAAFYTAACSALGIAPPVFEDGKEDFKIVSSERLKRVLSYRFTVNDPLKMLIDFDVLDS